MIKEELSKVLREGAPKSYGAARPAHHGQTPGAEEYVLYAPEDNSGQPVPFLEFSGKYFQISMDIFNALKTGDPKITKDIDDELRFSKGGKYPMKFNGQKEADPKVVRTYIQGFENT